MRPIVIKRKAGFLECLQVAADGARRHPTEFGERVDGDATGAGALDLAEDGPLADDFGITRHSRIVLSRNRSEPRARTGDVAENRAAWRRSRSCSSWRFSAVP